MNAPNIEYGMLGPILIVLAAALILPILSKLSLSAEYLLRHLSHVATVIYCK